MCIIFWSKVEDEEGRIEKPQGTTPTIHACIDIPLCTYSVENNTIQCYINSLTINTTGTLGLIMEFFI